MITDILNYTTNETYLNSERDEPKLNPRQVLFLKQEKHVFNFQTCGAAGARPGACGADDGGGAGVDVASILVAANADVFAEAFDVTVTFSRPGIDDNWKQNCLYQP